MKIHGREYTEVAERVRLFREKYNNYKLVSDMIYHEPGIRAIFKASVLNENNEVVSTGWAEELRGEPFLDNGKPNINYDNFIEIADTSACGRALGFMNIGINTGIASADEVANAVNRQQSRTVATTSTTAAVSTVASDDIKYWDGVSPIQLFDHFVIDGITYKTMKNKTDGRFFGLAIDETVPQNKKFYKF
jgi:hypothetical protein